MGEEGSAIPAVIGEEKKRLKVLCLHGYRQNAQIFREKSGALRKALKSRVDFEVISAPLALAVENGEEGGGEEKEIAVAGEGPRAWWFSNREWRSFSSKEVTPIADGFEESMEMVAGHVREKVNGPSFINIP